MADFCMPALGADMAAATLVEWKVAPGDHVKRGDLLATVETVKGAIDIEVFTDAVVEELVAPVGATVPVGGVLAHLRPDAGTTAAETVPPVAPRAPSPASAPPRTERTPSAPRHRVRASPVARRMAEALHVDLASVHGSGPHGAVLRADIEALAERPSPRRPVSGFDVDSMRLAIGAAMSRSKREIPHYYLSTELDLGQALAWLTAHNAGRPVAERLLPVALLVRAVALAASEQPEVNGTFQAGRFQPSDAVHLGVAIHLRGGGLVVPCVPSAQTLGVSELMARLTDLVARARSGRLRASELAGATLTVTNLGDQGVTSVFPIIHPPQVAMVGFGKVVERPWVVNGLMGPRPIVVASLAGDHRVSDGHLGARFLSRIDALIQHPEDL